MNTPSPPSVSPPRVEHHRVAVGTGEATPRLSWRVETGRAGWFQCAYEIEGRDLDDTVLWSSGRQKRSDSVLVPWPGPALRSRERVSVRVRVWGPAATRPSPWSRPTVIEAGLLEPHDWTAAFVGVPVDPAGPAGDRAPVALRREFTVGPGLLRARAYTTACGVFEAEINGRAVGDELFAPGWTSYHHRLTYRTHDITTHLHEGPNAIGAVLADGWFRGGYAWDRTGERYGSRTALLVQLELDYTDGRRQLVVTDRDWTWSTTPITRSGIYDGERHDARLEVPGWSSPGEPTGRWRPVEQVHPRIGTLTAPVGPPVRRIEELAPASVHRLADGTHRLDFGQNLVGRLRITVEGPAGTVVGMRHAEVLADGRLGLRPLRTAGAHDEYVLRGGGPETWEPRFTYHGFRYAEITGWPGALHPDAVRAVVCHDDMTRTGWFTCSDPDVERLHENVVWSMRGNFVSLPTDCPQRDERLGWTGDLQVFSPTATFLYDVAPRITEWMRDVRAETGEDGLVPLYVPHIPTSFPQFHCAVWGDVTTVVPHVLHERTGDVDAVRATYPTARAWVEACARLLDTDDVISRGLQLGDWLDPSAPPDRPHEGATDPYLVATAHLAHSARLLSRQAALLDRPQDAARYAALAVRVAAGFRREFLTPSGRCASDSQTAYALALRFDLLPGVEQRARAGRRLRDLVERDGHRIGTGFAGTPILLDALCDVDDLETAYRLLLQRGCPSWLYPITMGATTVWERWDSMLPDGRVNPGDMTSFNHYALGAVADWLHRVVAGLAPVAPGYRTFEVRPRPGGGLTAAGATHDTPYGRASVSWTRTDDQLQVMVTVPPNCDARVLLPDTDPVVVGSGSHFFAVAHRRADQDPIGPLPPRPVF